MLHSTQPLLASADSGEEDLVPKILWDGSEPPAAAQGIQVPVGQVDTMMEPATCSLADSCPCAGLVSRLMLSTRNHPHNRARTAAILLGRLGRHI